MNVVLDTNVLVSGLLRPYSVPGEIVRLLAAGEIELCYDGRILAEYYAVLRRPKFAFPTVYLDHILHALSLFGHCVVAPTIIQDLPDPADAPFLEVALAAPAECLITGNIRHFPAAVCRHISIVTPRLFLSNVFPGRRV